MATLYPGPSLCRDGKNYQLHTNSLLREYCKLQTTARSGGLGGERVVRRQRDHGKSRYKMQACSSVLTGGQSSALVTQYGGRNAVACDPSPPAQLASALPQAPAARRAAAGAMTRDSPPPPLCSFGFYCTIRTVFQLTLKRGYEILQFPKWTAL